MQDILQDAAGDLQMINGDIRIGESTRMHQQDILLARKGEYRLNPTGTIGIEDYLDDESPDALQREIRIIFAQDGMHVKNIGFTGNGNLNIDAKYD